MMATLKMQNHVTKLQTDFYEILNCRFKKKNAPYTALASSWCQRTVFKWCERPHLVRAIALSNRKKVFFRHFDWIINQGILLFLHVIIILVRIFIGWLIELDDEWCEWSLCFPACVRKCRSREKYAPGGRETEVVTGASMSHLEQQREPLPAFSHVWTKDSPAQTWQQSTLKEQHGCICSWSLSVVTFQGFGWHRGWRSPPPVWTSSGSFGAAWPGDFLTVDWRPWGNLSKAPGGPPVDSRHQHRRVSRQLQSSRKNKNTRHWIKLHCPVSSKLRVLETLIKWDLL